MQETVPMLTQILFWIFLGMYSLFAGGGLYVIWAGEAESVEADKMLWPMIALTVAAKYIFG